MNRNRVKIAAFIGVAKQENGVLYPVLHTVSLTAEKVELKHKHLKMVNASQGRTTDEFVKTIDCTIILDERELV